MPPVTLCIGACSLLEYDTQTKEVKVLLDHLRFPNGVQLSPAEDFVLVVELGPIPLYESVATCDSIPLLMDTWAVSSLGL